MKKIFLVNSLLLLIVITASAQKQLWGITRATNFSDVQGNIVQFDINGENAITRHHFNYPTGKLPQGKLLLASNGKLYGTATFGGIGSSTNTTEQDGNGVLYEYDLIFDTFKVLHLFNGTLAAQVNPSSSLIEPIPGKLYGGTAHGGFYVYDIATGTVSYLNHTYSFEAMGAINSDLIIASNGFVYAISAASFPCTVTGPNQPNQGSLVKINTATNTAERVAVFGCSSTTTINAFGGFSMIEALSNKILFLTGSSAFLPSEGYSYPVGGIIEFNTLTNELTQKFTFDAYSSSGFSPTSFVAGDNGNLYGVCSNGGDTYRSPFTTGLLHKAGTLFQYNPNSNTVVKLTDFETFRNQPLTIIKLTTGDFTGNLGSGGLFRYNLSSNSLQFPDILTYSDAGNQLSAQNLIEICRKPSYHFFDVDTFNYSVGDAFSFDIQNTNAANYVWKKDGVIVPGQSSGVLLFPALTLNDSGHYTCQMTNECGTTTTMPLYLNVLNVVPLRLINFSGTRLSGYCKLHWETANEINTKYFELERSSDAINFSKITSVNADIRGSYNYNDNISFEDDLIYYRLKMIDNDGSYTYSAIIKLLYENNNSVIIYPNPVTKVFTLSVNKEFLNSTAILSDSKGAILRNICINTLQQQIRVSNLQNGIYFITFYNGKTFKLIKE